VDYRGELDYCSTFIYFMKCSEEEPQLHQSWKRTCWCFTGGRWTTVLLINNLMNQTALKRSHSCTRAVEGRAGVLQRGGGPLFYILFTL
jgi:hypothetical protein